LRGPISKREHKPPRPAAMIRPRPIVPQSAYWRNWLLLGFLLSGCSVAIAFWFHEALWPLSILKLPQSTAPAHETDRHAWRTDRLEQKEAHRTPRLTFQNLRAAVNQPLALGIALINGTGGETLVLSGFVAGTSLSAGTALGTTRWSVPGRDLDKAFVSAPENFDGIMQITATLYSSRQDILETKEVRFEWNTSHKGDKLPVQMPAQRLLP
jgi:hypothetical protein